MSINNPSPAWDVTPTEIALEAKNEEKTIYTNNNNELTDHLRPIEALVVQYKTDVNLANPRDSNGLTKEEAELRLKTNGKNLLTPPKERPEILKFLYQFTNLLMVLLIVAAFLSCMTYGIDPSGGIINLYLGLALFGIVILTCLVTYYQEHKSGNIMASIRKLLTQNCKVIRDGKESIIQAENLVVGDIVYIKAGDKIPADIRMIYCADFKVECSSLTGESEPVTLNSEQSIILEPLDAHNIAFNGSLCLNGNGVGLVIRTGDETQIGKINDLASSVRTRTTELQREIRYFIWFITILSLVMGVIFFIVGVARGKGLFYTFVNGFIGVIVANVPQGLPATVTSLLTITARVLAERKVFVKHLESIETLGSINVIASDKTGTITENRMTVQNVWCSGEYLNKTVPALKRLAVPTSGAYFSLYTIMAVCNNAHFVDAKYRQEKLESEFIKTAEGSYKKVNEDSFKKVEEGSYKRVDPKAAVTAIPTAVDVGIIGDASETALLRFADGFKPIETIRERLPMLFEIPFNSTNKYHVVIIEDITPKSQYSRKLLIKGAPEVILSLCKNYLKETTTVDVDDVFKSEFQNAYECFGGQGERVLGFAQLSLDTEKADAYNEAFVTDLLNQKPLTFIGLVSMMDPPREGVLEAVEKCRTAGVKVVMITGDHAITATAIGKKIGIFGNTKTRKDIAVELGVSEDKVPANDANITGIIISGKEQFEPLSDEDWAKITQCKEVIFSRMTPQYKLQIVKRFQDSGHVVAVTGDGVNDAPALKQADIGVAMGLGGSDVAKEAADVILMDDNFASIVIAIEQGRTIYDNLKKTIAYTLTHLWPEVVPVLMWLTLDFPLGITSALILTIDCGTELGPAISLAFEKRESDVMQYPPRDTKHDRLVSPKVLCYSYLIMGNVQAIFCNLNYFLFFYYKYGITPYMLWGTADTYFSIGSPDFYGYPDYVQVNMLSESNACYYVCLVFSQFFHIWMCKTRRQSVFIHGFFSNTVMLYGVILQIFILLFVVYTPFMQIAFTTFNVSGVYWTTAFLFVAFCWNYDEGRKWFIRNYPNGFAAKYLYW